MLRGVLAIRGQAAARGYGFIAVEGREDDVFVLGSEVTDEHGGPATRGEWSALDGRAVEIGDVITTARGDQATNVRLLPVENASTDGGAEASTDDADAGVPEDAANEEPWAAGIRAHLELRGWTQGELASRSSLKPNTVGAVLRGDPTSTRTLTAIAAGFGVGVAALFDGGVPRAGRPLDRGAGASRRGAPDAGRGERRRDPARRADPGRVGRRRAGGPGGCSRGPARGGVRSRRRRRGGGGQHRHQQHAGCKPCGSRRRLPRAARSLGLAAVLVLEAVPDQR